MDEGSPLRGVLEVLRAIERKNDVGTYAIETDLRPEILMRFSDLFNTYFQTYNGDFQDVLAPDNYIRELPKDVSLERAETESCLFQWDPQNSKTRRITYEMVDDQMEAFLETINEGGLVLNRFPLSTLDQRSFAILASIIAAPLLSIKRERRKIGIMFDGSVIDWRNWECLRDYLNKISSSDNLAIFLLVFTGSLGRIKALYSNKIDRAGIYSSGVFTKVNSYGKSIDIVSALSSSLRSSSSSAPILVFFGAGASVEAGMPSTKVIMTSALKRLLDKPDELESDIDELKKELRKKIISDGKLLKDEGETEENLRITFERVMTWELDQYERMSESPTLNKLKKIIDSTSPSVAHYNISKLVDSEHKPILLTTNYDNLVERSLNRGFKPFYKDEDFKETDSHIKNYFRNSNAEVPVFKFHGTIEDFESIKASVQHTRSLEPNKNMFMTRLLKGDLLKNAMPDFDEESSTIRAIFIGYSFNDSDINSVLRSVQSSDTKLHVYTVNPNQRTNQILIGFARTDYMNSRISLPFSIFSEEILSKLVI